MHLCVCGRIYVYPASCMHVPRLSCLSCKFCHCYWIPFHRIPGVVMVVFMSSLAAPRVVIMAASGAARDAWRFVFSTGDPCAPVVLLVILHLLFCTKTPERGCECIYIYSNENLNLIFLLKKCYCMSHKVFRCDFNNVMSLLILLILYMYFVRNDEYKMSNQSCTNLIWKKSHLPHLDPRCRTG